MIVPSCWYCRRNGTTYERLFDSGIPGALEPTEEMPCGICGGLGFDQDAYREALALVGAPSPVGGVCDAQGAILVEDDDDAPDGGCMTLGGEAGGRYL